jgi:hypothetical protein
MVAKSSEILDINRGEWGGCPSRGAQATCLVRESVPFDSPLQGSRPGPSFARSFEHLQNPAERFGERDPEVRKLTGSISMCSTARKRRPDQFARLVRSICRP